MVAATARQWLTTCEVAHLIGVHDRTVQRWCKDGLLQARRVGRKIWRIPREAVQAMLGSS